MIGDLIRRARLARGWSQRDLAKRAGVLRNTVHLAEVEKNPPLPRTVAGIGRALDLDPATLAGLPAWADADMGARLAILRWRKGLSQIAAARLAGVAGTSLCLWERGERAPRPNLLDCLTLALCGRTAEVLEGEDPGWRHE